MRNNNINYLKKSHIPIVVKEKTPTITTLTTTTTNPPTGGLANNNKRKEIDSPEVFSGFSMFNSTHTHSKLKHTQSFSNGQPYVLSPIESKFTKNQNKLGSIQRLYIPPQNQENSSLDKHVLSDEYFKAPKNRLNDEHSKYINDMTVKIDMKKRMDFQLKIKDLKSTKIDDILVKKAILNSNINLNDRMNFEALFSSDVTDEQLEEMLTSESFIVCKAEKSLSLYDLISFLKVYLKKIEKNYSLDELYTFLKTNVTNGYRNFTVEYLEKYSKGSYTSSLGVYNDGPKETQLQVNKGKNRSWSQLKQTNNSHYNQYLKQTNNKVTSKPVQKLIDHLNLFRTIFQIVQRDLLVNIFLLSDNPDSVDKNGMIPMIKPQQKRPNSRSMNDLSRLVESDYPPQYQQRRQRLVKKLDRYHDILHGLSEKLMLLINDHKRCDLKLLSPHSALQAKYLYYKHGEYILRLTTDIITKFQMILNICQTVYYLNYKLKENNLGQAMDSEYITESAESDREFNYYACSKDELKKQNAVLKIIPRKKMQAFQKLPKIANDTLSNSNAKKDYALNGKSKTTMLKLDKGSSGEAVDMLGQSLKATKLKNLNSMITNHQRKAKVDNAIEVVAKSDRETIIEGLKRRLDSSDSIIRETDSDSIASEADSLFCLNADDSLEYEEQLKYPIEIFIQPKNKNLALAELNSDVP